jgi:uncharacterized protein (UPF0335 family)
MLTGKLLHDTIADYEALDEKRMQIQQDQKDLLKDAAERGADKGTLKRLIRERRRDQDLVTTERELLDSYRDMLESFEATPLGASAKGSTEPTDGVSQLKRARKGAVPSEAEQLAEINAAKNADDQAAAGAEVSDIKTAATKRARGKPAELEAERQKEAADRPEPMFGA